MSLADDTAREVMGWRGHVRNHWHRPGRPAITVGAWRPAYDMNQALEVLSHATRGASWLLSVKGGVAPLYTLEAAGVTVGPGLSLPELMCELALAVVR